MFALHVNRSRHEHKTSAANRRWALCCYAQRSSLRWTNCRPACREMEHSGGFWMGSTAATFWIMQVLKSAPVSSSTFLSNDPSSSSASGRSGSQNLCQGMNIKRLENKDDEAVSLLHTAASYRCDRKRAVFKHCKAKRHNCSVSVNTATQVEISRCSTLNLWHWAGNYDVLNLMTFILFVDSNICWAFFRVVTLRDDSDLSVSQILLHPSYTAYNLLNIFCCVMSSWAMLHQSTQLLLNWIQGGTGFAYDVCMNMLKNPDLSGIWFEVRVFLTLHCLGSPCLFSMCNNT